MKVVNREHEPRRCQRRRVLVVVVAAEVEDRTGGALLHAGERLCVAANAAVLCGERGRDCFHVYCFDGGPAMKVDPLNLRKGDEVGGGDVVVSKVIEHETYVSVVARCTNRELVIRAWRKGERIKVTRHRRAA